MGIIIATVLHLRGRKGAPHCYCSASKRKGCGHNIATVQYIWEEGYGHNISTVQYLRGRIWAWLLLLFSIWGEGYGHDIATVQCLTGRRYGHNIATVQCLTGRRYGHNIATVQYLTVRRYGHNIGTVQCLTGRRYIWARYCYCSVSNRKEIYMGMILLLFSV